MDSFAKVLSKDEALRLRQKYFAAPTTLYFYSSPLKIVSGEKHYMYDEEGNQYLDCINNVAHVGHCHPHVTTAATQQLPKLYTNNRYLHDTLSTYVQRLVGLFPASLDVCFLTNSGSEANDLALQLARAHTGGSDVIAVEGSYHGTVTSCYEISHMKWRDRPEQKAAHVHLAPQPNMYRGTHSNSSNPGHAYALEVQNIAKGIERNGKKLAAFIMESMQSCGGQILPPQGYLEEAFRYTREAGGVCIADEVQVGFGRCGTHYWAFETQGVVPDVVTIGKPMGNGHPISGLITTRQIADSYFALSPNYFNTYAGNPVSCAVAHAVLDVIEDEKLMENARDVGTYALRQLRQLMTTHDVIGDVRGMGLFIGVEFVKDKKSKIPAPQEAQEIQRRMKDKYVLVSIEGLEDNVLKFKPPMTFTNDDVDRLVKILDEAATSTVKALSGKDEVSNPTSASSDEIASQKAKARL